MLTTLDDVLDVVIVGGGPGGLAVAAALLRVLPAGTKLKVLEASRSYTQQGAGVLLNINGARALEAIHPALLHNMVAEAEVISGIATHNDLTGERMPWVRGGDHVTALQDSGFTACLVEWNQIRDALYRTLPPGIVAFGCKATSCAPPPASQTDGASASTSAASEASGEPGPLFTLDISRQPPASAAEQQQGQQDGETQRLAVRARHVIAADGYFSRVRKTAGDGQGPVFRQRLTWRGSLTRSELGRNGAPLPSFLGDHECANSSHLWVPINPDGSRPPGPPETLLLLYPAANGDRLVWAAFAPLARLQAKGETWPPGKAAADGAGKEADEGEGEAMSVQASGATGPDCQRRLLAAFSHLPAEVRGLLAATPPERITEHGISNHEIEGFVKGAWARGRLVAVGDAAHSGPTDGQGANLAMEDAAVLGACVRKHGLGPEAFTAWEAERQPRVAAILGDRTPGAAVRTPLIRDAKFERLWSPAALIAEAEAAGAGPTEAAGVVAVATAVRAAGSEEEAAQVVLSWSRGVVSDALGKKVAAHTETPAPQSATPPPPGGWTFR